MLGSGLSNWKRTPFSYQKLCDIAAAYLACGLFIALMAASFAGPVKHLLAGRIFFFLALGALMLVVALFHRLAVTLIWRNLGSRVRDNIPFDAREARLGKGTVRSLRDCWSLLCRR